MFEPLEDRVILSAFVVTSLDDEGGGSFRQAILDANGTAELDTITFSIGAGTQTIHPRSLLPTVTRPVVIDGTAPAAFPDQIITINGALAPGGDGLVIEGGGSTVRGLVISGFVTDKGPEFAGLRLRHGGGNLVQGNQVGTDAAGLNAVPNNDGIIIDDSADNTIGGTTIAQRNLLSGNAFRGVAIAGSGSMRNIVIGNLIGADASGSKPLPNQSGVVISSFTNRTGEASGNTIGGTQDGAGNVISGNLLLGIEVRGDRNVIQHNLIGTTLDGLGRLPNDGDHHHGGVVLIDTAKNTIGGTIHAARNVISGNGGDGIQVLGVGSSQNLVEGNYVGIKADGSAPLGNGGSGITISGASNNTIGGTSDDPDAEPGNVISGNSGAGVSLGVGPDADAATNNLVLGNIIGLDNTGTLRDLDDVPENGNEFGNGADGVYIDNAPGNTIGSSTEGSRNVISGNRGGGIQIHGASATGNLVVGNRIGTDGTGTTDRLGNALDGVLISGAPGNIIGDFGFSSEAANLISGNGQYGVRLEGEGSTGNQLRGNRIGTKLDGKAALANTRDGVYLDNAPGNLIGGLLPDDGNLISGNGGSGVLLLGTGAHDNQVRGNRIGTDVTGFNAVGNHDDGIQINGAPHNTIGAETRALGNVISGNMGNGVWVIGTQAAENLIRGNDIGTTAGAVTTLGNQQHGVAVHDAPSNTIGDSSFDEFGRQSGSNIIGGNKRSGIHITDPGAKKNRVVGNFIGTDDTALVDLGNGETGVFVLGADDNTIGGTSAGEGNTISHNGASLGTRGFGVEVATGVRDSIRHNAIYANAGRAIDLGGDAQDLNDLDDSDTGPNVRMNYPVIRSIVSTGILQIIHWTLNTRPFTSVDCDFFANSAVNHSGYGDGERFLLSQHVAVGDSGFVEFTTYFPSGAARIAATATDSSGNTSELSMVDSDADGLADAWELHGIDIDDDDLVDLILPGADPMHKDLYVEVDAMTGQAPLLLFLPLPKLNTGTSLDYVVDAFLHAPQALVQNPDSADGVNLHIQLDELDIPDEPWTGDADGDGKRADEGDTKDQKGWPFFHKLKQGKTGAKGGFGTAEERTDPTTVRAKSLAYRYCVFADQFVWPTAGGGIDLTYSGNSEFALNGSGNDFMVTLGAWTMPTGVPFGREEQQAGTFMHELGHTLGLGHGGGDFTQFKPNYHSIMNYKWQIPNIWMYEDQNGNGSQDSGETDVNGNAHFGDSVWKLDYSRNVLPTLDEKGLDESIGIGGASGGWFNLGPGVLDNVQESGWADWNLDKVVDPPTYSLDINSSGSTEKLFGHEDWSGLNYGFLNSPYFASGVSQDERTDTEPEMNYELYQELSGLNPPTGPGILELSDTVSSVRETAGAIAITVVRTGGADGAVSVRYTTSAGTASPGADYDDASGVLTFADGQRARIVIIPIHDDGLAEDAEAFTVTLTDATGGAALGTATTAAVTIEDDEVTRPATFFVNSTEDSGPGTLRQAILDANEHLGTDRIDFALSGGTMMIPLSPLPPITDAVVIDATTQPGYQGQPIVQLMGVLAGDDADGLTIQAGPSTVKGLIIDGFRNGIVLEARGNTIAGNWLGPEPLGAIYFDLDNRGAGLWIRADSDANVIGGTDPTDRNVVSSNQGAGIVIDGDSNRVIGNYIGTDLVAPLFFANGGFGVEIHGSDNVIGTAAAGQGNMVSGNYQGGIQIAGAGARGNRIQGNRIGLDSTGMAEADNFGDGILIADGAAENVIGGTGPGEGNIISQNVGAGIRLTTGARANRIQGNLVGLTGDGLGFAPNHDQGIRIEDSSDNVIGGIESGAGNRIANNVVAGVAIVSGVGNAVRGNAIFPGTFGAQPSPGIDLGLDGPSPNDPLDADDGPNRLQNSPMVTGVVFADGQVTIEGVLDSTPRGAFLIDLYASDHGGPDGDVGEVYLVSIPVTTDDSGHAGFRTVLPMSTLPGFYLTATATDARNNTSEFSPSLALDTDGDGVTDADEATAANGGDGNADGLLDRYQGDVASLRSGMTLVAASGTRLSGVHAVPNPSPGDVPGRATFPLGLLAYRIEGLSPGAATTLQILVPAGNVFNTYFRYGPVPAQGESHWEIFTFDGITGAEIDPVSVTLHLADGQRGDDDGAADGAIEQLGGPTDGQAVFLVTNTDDDGPGSLRQAILDSNARPTIDVIKFAIDTGAQTIAPLHILPTITDPVLIDGTTQPGYAGSPLIVLSGARNADLDVNGRPRTDIIGLRILAGSTTVRGLVINNFNFRGISIEGNGGNVIEGNFIGTDVTGTVAEGNKLAGVVIANSSSNRIGNTNSQARNVISGNSFSGIQVFQSIGTAASHNVIEGNFIGTQADGLGALGNGRAGVDLRGLAFDTRVGGTSIGAGNVIAFNGGAGVDESVTTGRTDTAILGNSIHDNGGLGILTAAPRYNEIGGHNIQTGWLNYPVLSSARLVGDDTIIQGRFNGRPNAIFRIEFFSSATLDGSGFGEGQNDLGAISVTTDADGNADFTTALPTLVSTDRVVTATATDSDGNTSEFSARLTIGDVLGSTYVVNTPLDTDDGVADAVNSSLREAILAANNHPGLDVIHFQIDSGFQSIAVLFDLPAIIDPVVIDASTQPGFAGMPLIELRGTRVGIDPGPAPDGLRLVSGGITVRGLVINRFMEAVEIFGPGDGNTITGCFIGPDSTGTIRMDSGNGILIRSSSHNLIGGDTPGAGNLLSGNNGDGVQIDGGSGNVIQGNLIGTDRTGTRNLGNGPPFSNTSGIGIRGDGNTIGGTTAGARNVISGNADSGMSIGGSGNVVQGNFIGTDITGTRTIPNRNYGVFVQNGKPGFNLIGGAERGAGNLISGNGLDGVFLLSAPGNWVQGNFIGTDFTGTLPLGNGTGIGVRLNADDETTLGGPEPGAGNLISGNALSGIVIEGSSDVVVQGNRIGTQADGTGALGNRGDGVTLITDRAGLASTRRVRVGGPSPGEGNLIAFNNGAGVDVAAGQGITIIGNGLFANGGLGIDLEADGTTLNDDGDVDAGPNGLQNFPVITEALAGLATHVSANLRSRPLMTYTISFYASQGPDPSGFGEGQRYLGSVVVNTDVDGLATLELDLTAATRGGEFLTATSTDPDGNTSEFSPALQLAGPVRLDRIEVNHGAIQRSMVTSLTITFTGIAVLDPGAFCVVRRGGDAVGILVKSSVIGDQTVVEITFEGADVIGGSVADGRYDLTIFADRVHDLSGQALDGDGDGNAGGDLVAANAFFRLFGDGTGDGVVDNRDVALFRQTFNKRRSDPDYLAMFDYEANSVVDRSDQAEMMKRYGKRI